MKHDTKLHHWITLLAQLEEKLEKLNNELHVVFMKRKMMDYDDKNMLNKYFVKLADKHYQLSSEVMELESRIQQIKSQIDQY